MRVGNLIEWEDKVCSVNSLSKTRLSISYPGVTRYNVQFDEVKGIPISIRWLERLGFDNSNYKDIYENDRMGFMETDTGWQLYFLTETNLHEEQIYYKHVHEIQNVFYALTKQELRNETI